MWLKPKAHGEPDLHTIGIANAAKGGKSCLNGKLVYEMTKQGEGYIKPRRAVFVNVQGARLGRFSLL